MSSNVRACIVEYARLKAASPCKVITKHKASIIENRSSISPISYNLSLQFFSSMAHQQKDSIYPPWPRKLSKEHLDFLQEEIIDWSLANGLAIRLRPDSGLVKEQELASATTAPVTVFPSLLGAAQYHEARKIQCSYNELYARIASDRQWLGGVVEE